MSRLQVHIFDFEVTKVQNSVKTSLVSYRNDSKVLWKEKKYSNLDA